MSRRMQDYRLPDGTVVAIHADVSRGQQAIGFQLKGGTVVEATLVREERVRQLTDRFDRRLCDWSYKGVKP